ncbi:competence pheromone ComX [Viridibacillus sp. FSL R5-0477]|uniref:ComX pheromone n=2 Tax=Viridibacillus TaxID=496496 RepID=W4EW88_9BACL|nr:MULTISPECIES: competence pheromone ComX [Viridibacillus]ETT84091.1 hypothetical protein C176_12023 [Viridibacillus arenosi FSL R5-213]KOO51823.1 competence protein ComX [Viridibacillus arvi]OMC79320.1 competence protein ComX [Viridibacillus sp. FSL H8-0123]OMC86411.1 competence protein ComX [Viridibacillus sp. FSL H7-0596]OMC90108.1 competence protein ComX [Viridibacillus arenosi]
MMKFIQYLQENPAFIQLLKDNKLSLVGVTSLQQKAIVEAYDNDVCLGSLGWRPL